MEWAIWKRNYSEAKSYRALTGQLCKHWLWQNLFSIKQEEETVTESIACFIIVDFFNTLKEKVSHLGEKYLGKHVGLYIGQKMTISFLLHLKKQKKW